MLIHNPIIPKLKWKHNIKQRERHIKEYNTFFINGEGIFIPLINPYNNIWIALNRTHKAYIILIELLIIFKSSSPPFIKYIFNNIFLNIINVKNKIITKIKIVNEKIITYFFFFSFLSLLYNK